MQVNGSYLPSNIAKAYGLTPRATPEQAAAVRAAREAAQAQAAQGVQGTERARAVEGVARADSAQRPSVVEGAQRLVSAIVPGAVDFSTEEPTPSAPAIPFYRHPADANAAATSLQVGRRLDASG